MQALDNLSKKINLLLKKQAALEAENKRLKSIIAAHEETEMKLNAQLASLDNNLVSVRIDNKAENTEEKENMVRQLDKLIQEIDIILNTLND
jgi:predicted RNase H-like nuclease (RuvC/YqgF family)